MARPATSIITNTAGRAQAAGKHKEIDMEFEENGRGFKSGKFTDRYGNQCSLQESSLATESCIWLGCDDADPKIMVPEKGWQKVVIPGMLCSTRMHLTQAMVAALLPALQHFVETGELP